MSRDVTNLVRGFILGHFVAIEVMESAVMVEQSSQDIQQCHVVTVQLQYYQLYQLFTVVSDRPLQQITLKYLRYNSER